MVSQADTSPLGTLFGDAAIDAVFSEEQLMQYVVAIEAALASVQARQGIIPAEAGAAIVAAAQTLSIDWDQLRPATEKDGVPISELVRQLRQHVSGEAASYVHWGATTQDMLDTALILQIRAAGRLLEAALQELITNLAQLAARHRRTLMAGRTHAQQALPIPFGLKVAGWLAPLLRDQQRLAEIRPRVLVIQFGGAAGTLASLGQSGIPVMDGLAAELDLSVPLMPWHTQRDSLAELAGWLSLVTGSLAKMAQDIILLAQSEVGEAHESGDRSRGGSSAMPQKSNPVVSEHILAIARTNAALLSAMHQALVQEHERGTHGWQVEWLTLPQMFSLTGAALRKAVWLSENLHVDTVRMAVNVRAADGLMLAESLTLALAPLVGHAQAKQVVKAACQIVLNTGRHLVDVVRETSGVALDWETLKDETAYFGSANAFIDRVLREAEKSQP